MIALLHSIGTATPARGMTQREAESFVCGLVDDESRERAVRAIYRRSGIDRRGLVMSDGDGGSSLYDDAADGNPGTAARMSRFLPEASALATNACRDALGDSIDPASITHVVTASCTGFAAPGVEHALIDSLGLRAGVRRTNIGFMGCHAAINALAVAKAFAESSADSRVLVCCVELSSLHLQVSHGASDAVANALFGDGAAAAVVGCDASLGGVTIRTTEGVVIPGTRDRMGWRVGDHGFAMDIGADVPEILAREVPPWVDAVLDNALLSRDDVRGWALHPGGPRVLDALSESLGLRDESLRWSREVLRANGNMSSTTVLFVIDALLRECGDRALPLVSLAFGPGLAGEAIVLTA